jgi:hypothetical protein
MVSKGAKKMLDILNQMTFREVQDLVNNDYFFTDKGKAFIKDFIDMKVLNMKSSIIHFDNLIKSKNKEEPYHTFYNEKIEKLKKMLKGCE